MRLLLKLEVSSYVSICIISIYIVILASVYFLKRKYNFLESKVYKFLLVSSIITLILDIGSMYVLECGLYGDLVIRLCSKLYYISLFTWLILFIFYVLLNKTTVKYDNFKSLLKQSILCKGWFVISIILLFFLIILRIDYRISPAMFYGDSVVLIYALGIIGSLFLLFMLLFILPLLSVQ